MRPWNPTRPSPTLSPKNSPAPTTAVSVRQYHDNYESKDRRDAIRNHIQDSKLGLHDAMLQRGQSCGRGRAVMILPFTVTLTTRTGFECCILQTMVMVLLQSN